MAWRYPLTLEAREHPFCFRYFHNIVLRILPSPEKPLSKKPFPGFPCDRGTGIAHLTSDVTRGKGRLIFLLNISLKGQLHCAPFSLTCVPESRWPVPALIGNAEMTSLPRKSNLEDPSTFTSSARKMVRVYSIVPSPLRTAKAIVARMPSPGIL